MSRRSGSRSRSVRRLEELFEKVRSRKGYGRFGWLDDFLTEELGELERLIRQEVLEERGRLAASSEADFPPSGVREVSEGNAQHRVARAPGADVERHD